MDQDGDSHGNVDRVVYVVSGAMTPASPPQPTKACTFDVSCPPGASVDSIFDAAAAIVGTAELFSVQHLGGTNFQLSVTSSSAMSRIVNAGVLTIGGTSVPIVPVGPQVTSITCLYLPIYVRNEALAAALSLYGKVLDIRFGVYQDHPNLRTGTRYIRMEMKESTPVPNFLRVSGHRATFDYRGLKRVCRRCQQEGHLKAACNVPYCTRCAAFGHDTVGCAAGCGRCGAAHATVDCTQRRSYSAVAGCGQGDFPALTPASQTPKSQDRPPTTPPPPPAATVATQGSGDTSAPAEPPVTTPSEITPTSQQSQLASDTDADSNASQDAAEAALSNAVETVSVHAHTPPSPGSGEVLVKEEPPPTPELRPSPLPSWSEITEDSASSSDDRLIIDEVACDKDSALPRGRDRRRGTSEELRKTCSRSRSPHGGAEDGKRVLSSSGESGSPRSTPAPAAASKRLRKDLTALSESSCITVTKQIEVLQFARTARCDLLFLQETNFHRQRDVDLFKQRYGVDCFFSYATTRSSGVGVVIFNRSLLRLSACCFDPDGRYIAFDFSLDGTRFRAVGVYAPTQRSQSPAFFKSLDVHLLDARNCLLLGDFNCVVDSRRDVRGPGYGRTTWNAGELIRLMQNFDLVDCWTLLDPWPSAAALPTSRFIRRVKSALFSFFWSGKTELATRPVVCLPRERGGWGFPCLDIAPTVLHLKTTLKILRDVHGPARSLALYFVGHSRRVLGVESPSSPGPCAETPPPDYRRAIQLFKRLEEQTPQLDVVETPTARLTEVLLEPQISATQVELGDSFSWSRFTSCISRGTYGTSNRLLRWGVSRTDECPNCGNRETNVHAVKECVVARTFWRVIRTSFHGLGVGLYLLRGRCPPGVFVRLLLAAAEYVLWRNRCCAVRQARRSRALWPLLWRLRRELVGHLEEQLFFLGEQEFLRRWSCRYLSVRDSRIKLRFRYLDNL
ncbi:hypothetical protein HPB47_009893 [Ixodes persulcatus]|uniref:Uncharacterized protein n=1 Tax=Ixodes persulcatus TaxID=34615 RepID=A0AC60P0N1_IXOPE|nr:hypothetical protein HPB47_009893 [Ixodes persulcatus]